MPKQQQAPQEENEAVILKYPPGRRPQHRGNARLPVTSPRGRADTRTADRGRPAASGLTLRTSQGAVHLIPTAVLRGGETGSGGAPHLWGRRGVARTAARGREWPGQTTGQGRDPRQEWTWKVTNGQAAVRLG